ncbi:hypothetical protein [Methylobacterium isbiliense]|uniref:Uncharacterized protein n=1 Tax=Methylobacterium isbiliense TaxID=315478 RepID=A0ABQ4SJW2_9HYPH|nr:hypothetical protein [Methylobacterium isbiliense]MDN3624475.1 hypothetical protein [Methylobacterium isbiliense]GJE02168.1 hypothetical protein GMJLKIPL_4112 [Methylobacterium isbiliense]
MTDAVVELWRVLSPGPDNLFSSPEFVRLKEALQRLYPEVGKPVFALGTALRSLGLPSGLPQDGQYLSFPPDEAARRLDLAVRAKRARRLHLAPPDLADDLPPLQFGPAALRRFSADELRAVVDAPRLARVFPPASFEAERFAECQWLVVEKDVPLDRPPEARAMPVLFTDMRQDFGRIEPHSLRFGFKLHSTITGLTPGATLRTRSFWLSLANEMASVFVFYSTEDLLSSFFRSRYLNVIHRICL